MPNPYDINPRSPSLRRLIVIGAIFTVLAVIASILMIQKSQGKFDEFVRVTAALTDVGDGLPIRSDVKYFACWSVRSAPCRPPRTARTRRHDQLLASVGSINSAVGQLSRISENVTPDLLEMIQRQPGWAAHVAGPGRERMAYALYNVPAVMKGIARVTQSGEYINAYVCDLNSTIFDWLGRYIPAVVAGATDGHNIKHSAKCRS